MSATLYLTILLSVMVIAFGISVPSLLMKKCPQCGARNGLDATNCHKCHQAFPGDAES